jgi:hypothetical protein
MEIKNIHEYKFILSSGCSYGIMPHISVYPFDWFYNKTIFDDFRQSYIDTDNKIISLGVNIGSQGSDWQADSIIQLCTKILELGVKQENIYCVVEWSQWHRYNIHPYNFINLDLSKFKFRDWNTFDFREINENKKRADDTLLNEIFKKLNITCSNVLYNVGKIEERIYVNPMHMNRNDFLKLGDDYGYFISKSQEIESAYMFESKIKNYLNNILKVQYFFEAKNLKYNFLFMQSALSEWHNIGDGVIKHELSMAHSAYQYMHTISDELIINPNYKKNNNQMTDIEVVMPETINEISKINFDNIWFHESEKYRRGGIDEWTLENLKEVGYINIKYGQQEFTKGGIICNYNQHPNYVAYINLWNKVTTNCDFMKINDKFLNFVNEKYWEDYEYDGVSKNNITISKKEWYRIKETPSNKNK